MSKFAKFLVDKWRSSTNHRGIPQDFPIEVHEGQYYSTLTGSDPPEIEIDFDALEKQIAELEAEFAALRSKP